MRFQGLIGLLSIAAVALATPALAHHSFAMFDHTVEKVLLMLATHD